MAGDSPTFNFNIGHTPKDIQEYFRLIKNHTSINLGSKEDALLFTALHHQKKLEGQDSSLLRYLNVKYFLPRFMNSMLLCVAG